MSQQNKLQKERNQKTLLELATLPGNSASHYDKKEYCHTTDLFNSYLCGLQSTHAEMGVA
jgi:hypothetical protein